MGFKDTAKSVNITPTPNSNTSVGDGYLGGKDAWAPVNLAAAANTYTGKGGSKRD